MKHLTMVMALAVTFLLNTTLHAQRKMETLGRGVTAVRSASGIFVNWRLFGKDPAGIGFNLYRSANGGSFTKVNGSVLTAGTCYTDTAANTGQSNAYYVKPVISGVEQAASGTFTLSANHATEPVVRIPIRTPASGYYTKCVWVGDLDGDGEYEYVIDRLAPFDADDNDIGLGRQFLEAYNRSGTRLWLIDMGASSTQLYNISPGAATISMGMYDGVTVGDLNRDGKAEVVLKVANGVKFPNGTVFANSDSNKQFMAILDGATGNMIKSIAFPTDFYAQAGKYGTQFGIGWQNGRPALIAWLRNRNTNKTFNDIFVSWYWNGGNIGQNWKLLVPGSTTPTFHANHQMRIVDVDGDGNDEVMPGGFCINADGTVRYKLSGIIHGDRFHVGKFDPSRSGLQGFGIQQWDEGLGTKTLDYYYDAKTGAVLWRHTGPSYDVGRGAAGDVDPAGSQGYEVWSFEGMYTARSNALVASAANSPWPNLRIWWDGDTLSEECDGTVINKFNPSNDTVGRLITGYQLGGTSAGHVPMLVGDIMGDWREEMVLMNSNYSELSIFTTNVPTSTRIYTLPHNPYYRNCLTVKGYYQSNHVDYFLGNGMGTPPVPNITY